VGRVSGKVKVSKETVLYGRRSSERTESQFPQGYLSLKVHLPSERGRVITASSAYDKGPGAQEPDEVKVSRPVREWR